MKRFACRLPALVLALGLSAGCIPEFEQALPSLSAARDARLPGIWTYQSDQETWQISFFAQTGACVEAVWVKQSRQPGRPVEVSVFTGHTACVGGLRYLCVRPRPQGDAATPAASTPYWIFPYEAGRRTLNLRLLSLHRFAALVEDGELRGQVRRRESALEAVRIRSASSDLAAALASRRLTDLSDETAVLRFRRVRGP